MGDLSLFMPGGEMPKWIGQLMRYLGACYPSWKPEPETALVYWDVLGDLDVQDVVSAARAIAASPGAFAPSPGDLREEAVEHMNERKRSNPHKSGCTCSLDCIGRLPMSKRWNALDASQRAYLEAQSPEGCADLRKAAGC